MPKITAVKIQPVRHTKLKAFASVVFDNCLIIRGLKVVDGCNGLFVAMPAAKKHDGVFEDLMYPLTTEFNRQIEAAVLSEYDEQSFGARRRFPGAADAAGTSGATGVTGAAGGA